MLPLGSGTGEGIVDNGSSSSGPYVRSSSPLFPSSSSPTICLFESSLGPRYPGEIGVMADIVEQYLERNIPLSGQRFCSEFIATLPPEIQFKLPTLFGAIYDTRYTKGDEIKKCLEAVVGTKDEIVTVIDVFDSVKIRILSELIHNQTSDNFRDDINQSLIAREYREHFHKYSCTHENINFLFYYQSKSLEYHLVVICHDKQSSTMNKDFQKWFGRPQMGYLQKFASSHLKEKDVAAHRLLGENLKWIKGWDLSIEQAYNRLRQGFQPTCSNRVEETNFRPWKTSKRGWTVLILNEYLARKVTLQAEGRLPESFSTEFKNTNTCRDEDGFQAAPYIDGALSELNRIIDLRHPESIPEKVETINFSAVHVVDVHIPFWQMILLALTNKGSEELPFDGIITLFVTKRQSRRELFLKLENQPPNLTLFYSYPSGRFAPVHSRMEGEQEEVYHKVILSDYRSELSSEQVNLIRDLKITEDFLNLLGVYGYHTDSLKEWKGVSIKNIIDRKASGLGPDIKTNDPSNSFVGSQEENRGLSLFREILENFGDKQFQIRRWKELIDRRLPITIDKRDSLQGESGVKVLNVGLLSFEEIQQEMQRSKENGMPLEILDVDFSVWRLILTVIRGFPHIQDFRKLSLDAIKTKINKKREKRKKVVDEIIRVASGGNAPIEYFLLEKDGNEKFSLVADYNPREKELRFLDRMHTQVVVDEDPLKPIDEEEWHKIINRKIDDELIEGLKAGGQKVNRLAEWKDKTIQSTFDQIFRDEYPKEIERIRKEFVLGVLYYSNKTGRQYYDPEQERYFDDSPHITEALSDPEAFQELVPLRKFRTEPPSRREQLVGPTAQRLLKYVEGKSTTIEYSDEEGKKLVVLCKVILNAMDQNAVGFRSADHPVLNRRSIERLQNQLAVTFHLKTWEVFTRFIKPPENFCPYSFLSDMKQWFAHRLTPQMEAEWHYNYNSKVLGFELNRRAIFTRGNSGVGKSTRLEGMMPEGVLFDHVKGGIGNADGLRTHLQMDDDGILLFKGWQVHDEAAAVRQRSIEEEMNHRTIIYGGIHDGRLLTLGELAEKLNWARKVGIREIFICDVDADLWFSILSIFGRSHNRPEEGPCVPFSSICEGFIDARKNRQSFIEAISLHQFEPSSSGTASSSSSNSSSENNVKVNYHLYTASTGNKPVVTISGSFGEILDDKVYAECCKCDESECRAFGDKTITPELITELEEKYGSEKIKGIRGWIAEPPLTVRDALERHSNGSPPPMDHQGDAMMLSRSSEALD